MNHLGKALVFIAACAGLAAAIVTGRYPAAFVRAPQDIGGSAHVIWASDVRRMADAALTYYGNAQATSSPALADRPEADAEARKKSADGLIRNALVADRVATDGAERDVRALIAETMKKYSEKPEFSTAISLVYGLDASGFMDLIVRPEAEREVLKKKNGWDDAALSAWIEKEFAAASIARFAK